MSDEQLYAIADYVPEKKGYLWLAGKPYKAKPALCGVLYNVLCEEGRWVIHIKETHCAHIGGHDWRIVKESALTDEERKMARLPNKYDPVDWAEFYDLLDDVMITKQRVHKLEDTVKRLENQKTFTAVRPMIKDGQVVTDEPQPERNENQDIKFRLQKLERRLENLEDDHIEMRLETLESDLYAFLNHDTEAAESAKSQPETRVGWIPHDGGECPVDEETIVEVRLRDNSERRIGAAVKWRWCHVGDGGADITHYRPAKQETDEAGWTPHDGGGCPVDPYATVQVRFKSGYISTPGPARALGWDFRDPTGSITHYRLVEAEPRPDSDGWIPWHGGKCPVDGDRRIRAMYYSGTLTEERPAKTFSWNHSGGAGDIIAYRPAKQEAWGDADDTYPMPEHGWTCFHCGKTFKTPGAARNHFGELPEDTTACVINSDHQRGLLMELRKEEAKNRRLIKKLREYEYASSDQETKREAEWPQNDKEVLDQQKTKWPQAGDHVYFIDVNAGRTVIYGVIWNGDDPSNVFLGIYPTREAAEDAAAKIKQVMEHWRSGGTVELHGPTNMPGSLLQVIKL